MKVTLNPLLTEPQTIAVKKGEPSFSTDFVTFQPNEVIEVDESKYSIDSLFSQTNKRKRRNSTTTIQKLQELGVDYTIKSCCGGGVVFDALMEVEE